MTLERKYKRDSIATLAAVRRWARMNPTTRPVLPKRGDIDDLGRSIEYIELTAEARALAQYVADQVEDSTWRMFYRAWETAYAESEPKRQRSKLN